VRSKVLEWVGLKQVRIERREPAVPPQRRNAPLDLGRPVPLAELPWRPSLPTVLGRPRAAYVDDEIPGTALSFTWRGNPVVLTELRGSEGPYIQKAAGAGTRTEPVRIAGEPGWWLAGAPHEFAYVDAKGAVRAATIRLAGPTLLWEHRGLLLRLEGTGDKQQALRIARSTEP
jgi:hypothetical protein